MKNLVIIPRVWGRQRSWRGAVAYWLLLVLVGWPKEAWVSGAMGARAVLQNYAISISEFTYAFGDDPPPTPAQLEAEARNFRERLAQLVTVTDAWLAGEIRAGRLAPVDVTIDTAVVEPPRPTAEAQALARPALIELPRCQLSQRNLLVEMRVALRAVPASAAHTALGHSLCARLLAAEKEPAVAQPLELVTPLAAKRDGLDLALDGSFSVPAKMLAAVGKARADFFKKAADVVVQSSHRFEKEHPGVTLRRIAGTSENLVRFYMHGPFGGFDLLTDVVVAKGVKRPSEVALKDALYHDWQAAGLPVQVGLPSLFSRGP